MQTIPLYRQLADHYLNAIRCGTLKVGDRMPSVRKLMQVHGVSLSTSLQLCRHLETEGWLEARPRSGYFVRQPRRARLIPAQEPTVGKLIDPAQFVGIHERVSEIISQGQRPVKCNLARATGGPALYPHQQLRSLTVSTLRRYPELLTKPISPGGNRELKAALAKRALDCGISISAEEVVITNGCIEALNLALRAVAQAGDVIAVESPTFYGLLQVLESLGMKALEIPTSPSTGISLEALELAMRTYDNIKAVVVVPHLQNPLGSIMPEQHKQRLVALCEAQQIPLIEDDSYSTLVDGDKIPTALKHWDHSGNVIFCASVHKILAPGLRVGWILGGRWQARVNMLKYAHTRYNEELSQIVAATFILSSAYDRHLRKLRSTLAQQRERTAEAIATYFPEGTRMNTPAGGVSIWVEMPPNTSSKAVFDAALEQSILVSPGLLYSNSNRFDHFLRINCGMPYTQDLDDAMRTLGRIIQHKSHLKQHIAA
ncbi:PLP-dependent aminotransferase family protein [Undibacterium sp. CY18W]|uniref:PLP-dependent aminotransferase family protein n=1 Tax=Undibacterium hunanense TaxID=2762292 RepID=A0ABR6ZZ41_9BURK|nr:PLP-dependent aminotransferase family protein [Undibacterium hunanense]MBC3920918.1 PLP-dependent aminotransferase family protein [Undibacterium hunanense]